MSTLAFILSVSVAHCNFILIPTELQLSFAILRYDSFESWNSKSFYAKNFSLFTILGEDCIRPVPDPIAAGDA